MVAAGEEVSKLKGNVMVRIPNPHRAGQKATAASPNVTCIGRLKRRLRKACASSAMSETGARVWPAVTSVSQPTTAVMPPDRYIAHAATSTKTKAPGRHQRKTGQHRSRTVPNCRRIDGPQSAIAGGKLQPDSLLPSDSNSQLERSRSCRVKVPSSQETTGIDGLGAHVNRSVATLVWCPVASTPQGL